VARDEISPATALRGAIVFVAAVATAQAPALSAGTRGITIVAPSDKAKLLDQCSRAVPKAGEGAWSPSLSLVRALETRLPAALKRSRPNEDWSGLTTKWGRR